MLGASAFYAHAQEGGICDRTQAVQDEIMAHSSVPDQCAEVTDEHLALLTGTFELTDTDSLPTTLRAGDFAGLVNVTGLTIRNQGTLNRFEPGALSGLTGVETVTLRSNDGLTELPGHLFEGLGTALRKVLIYDNDNLATLSEDLFQPVPGLTKLQLNNNALTRLAPNLFKGLTALNLGGEAIQSERTNQGLNLRDNQISGLTAGVFSDLGALQALDLENNPIGTLSSGVFRGLDSLRELGLWNTHAVSPRTRALNVQVGAFDGLDRLEYLRLGQNELTTLPAGIFSNLVNLGHLRLESNRFTSLPAGMFLGLRNLHTVSGQIHLDGRTFTLRPQFQLDTVVRPGVFHVRLTLREGAPFEMPVTLSTSGGTVSPNVVTLPRGAVQSEVFTVTQIAGHSTVGITMEVQRPPAIVTIGGQVKCNFDCFNRLRTGNGGPLVLSGTGGVCNRAQAIQDEITDHASIPDQCYEVTDEHLGLVTGAFELTDSDSLPSTLKAGAFAGLVNVTSLKIQNQGGLRSFEPGAFADLAGADTIELQDNAGLTELPGHLFEGLGTTLRKVFIHGNANLTTLSEDLFQPVPGLTGLRLNHNALTHLPAGLFRGLTSLNLGGEDFVPDDAGKGLRLDNNDLSDLPAGVFSGLDGLEALDLADNPIGTLSPGVFTGLRSLRNLSLWAIKVSDDQPPDVQTGAFAGLDRLEFLNLGNNRLTTLASGVFSDLENLGHLRLRGNAFETLPAGMFLGLVNLHKVSGDIHGDGRNFTLTPQFQHVADTGLGTFHVRLTLREGAPFEMPVTLSVSGGTASSGTATVSVVTLSRGATQTSAFTVAQAGNTSVELTMGVESPPGSVTIGGEVKCSSNCFQRLRTAAGSALSLDKLGPRPVGVVFRSMPASGDSYGAQLRETVSVAVNFDEDVVVQGGTPVFTLDVGGTPRDAAYVPELSTPAGLVFNYQLAAGDLDDDGIGFAADALNLNGASLADLAGNPAEAALAAYAVANDPGHKVAVRVLTLRFEPSELQLAPSETTRITLRLINAQALAPSETLEVTLDPSANRLYEVVLERTSFSPPDSTVEVTITARSDRGLGVESVEARGALSGARIVFGRLVVKVDREVALIPTEVAVYETSPVQVTVRTDKAVPAPLTVNYRVGADADPDTPDASSDDYTAPSGSVVIPAGGTETAILIPITDDTEIEPPREYFQIVLLASADYSRGPRSSRVTVVIKEGVCDRTPQVAEVLAAKTGDDHCAEVTSEGLAGAGGGINLTSKSIDSLKQKDFSGLVGITSLNFRSNRLTELPPGVFDGLVNLGTLGLDHNRLSALPPDVFSDLGRVGWMPLNHNRLEELPPNAFAGLRGLNALKLTNNPGSNFRLKLGFEFAGAASVSASDPVPLRLTLLEGAPYQLTAYLTASNATFGDGAPTAAAMIPAGSTRGETVFTVTRVSDAAEVEVSFTGLAPQPGKCSGWQKVPQNTGVCFSGLEIDSSASLVYAAESFESLSVSDVEFTSRPRYLQDAYIAGVEVITVDVLLSTRVTVDVSGGAPKLDLDVGGARRVAVYVPPTLSGEAATNRLSFRYALISEDIDIIGVELASAGSLRWDGALVFQGDSFFPANAPPLPAEYLRDRPAHKVRLSYVLSFDDVSPAVTEGSTLELGFRVAPPARVQPMLSVGYAFGDDNDPNTPDAQAADYSPGAGAVVVSTGAARGVIRIPITDDAEIEPPREYFQVRLSASDDYILERSTVTVMIKEGVCDRTPQVADALAAKTGAAGCAEVTGEDLAGVSGELNLMNRGITGLKPKDFSGVAGVTSLDFRSNELATLPPGVFSGLRSLNAINLTANPGSDFRLPLRPEWAAGVPAMPVPVTVRLTFRHGAPYRLEAALEATGGTLDGGASTAAAVIAAGSTQSATFILSPDSGTFGLAITRVSPQPDNCSGSQKEPPDTGVCFSGFEIVSNARLAFGEAPAVMIGVSITSMPANGKAYLGENREEVVVEVVFDKDVDLTRASDGRRPLLALQIGKQERFAVCSASSDPRKLECRYTSEASDAGRIGVAENPLRLNGAQLLSSGVPLADPQVFAARNLGQSFEGGAVQLKVRVFLEGALE